jgi:hypothetical protein
MPPRELLPAPFAGKSVKAARKEKKRLQLAKLIDSITAKAMRKVDGLYQEPTLDGGTPNPAYNPDATVPYVEATTATRVAVEVYKQTMLQRRDELASARELGVLLIRDRMKAEDWERHAAEVDESTRKHVVDVVAEVKK